MSIGARCGDRCASVHRTRGRPEIQGASAGHHVDASADAGEDDYKARELDIRRLIAAGNGKKEIAAQLSVTEKTLKATFDYVDPYQNMSFRPNLK
jgi:DNA-binding NarL/FixJ family response regulator